MISAALLIAQIAGLSLAATGGPPTAIANGIIGEPRLECGAGFIALHIRTKATFMGRIFLKRMTHEVAAASSRRGCEVRAADACEFANGKSRHRPAKRKPINNSINWRRLLRRRTPDSTGSEMSAGDSCVMRVSFDGDTAGGCPPLARHRSLNPRGVAVVATLVISFHPLFITQVDRMYRLQCFYASGTTEGGIGGGTDATMVAMVRAGLNVSSRPQLPLAGVAMPICRYEILTGGPDGTPPGFASLRQSLYHRWRCETPDADRFCMRVHSCMAGGTPIVDARGCALDRFLLTGGEIIYRRAAATWLEAGAWAPAYKQADRESLYFQCQIRIWRRPPGDRCSDCLRTSCDELSASLRIARSAMGADDIGEDDVDVDAELRVLEDLDDKSPAFACERARHSRKASFDCSAYNSNTSDRPYCINLSILAVCSSAIVTVFIMTNIIVYRLARIQNRINT